MKFFRTIHVLFLAFFLLFICTSLYATDQVRYQGKPDLQTHYDQAKFFYNQLKTQKNLGNSRDNWLKGVGNFRRIYLAEPKSDFASSCLFMLGRMYFDMYQRFGEGIDLGEAISYYRDVGSLFPNHRLADDAYYAVGSILLEEVNDPKRAAKSFGRVVSHYPNGDMHTPAVTMLKQLSQQHNIPLPSVMIDSSQLKKLTNVLPVKYWSSDNYTRVVIKASGAVTYREELLEEIGKQPRRLYIDFQNSYIEPRYRSPVPIEDGLLKRVRTGQYSPDTVRVVLDIESISSYKIFSLPDPFRVVIDVKGDRVAAPSQRQSVVARQTTRQSSPRIQIPSPQPIRPKVKPPITGVPSQIERRTEGTAVAVAPAQSGSDSPESSVEEKQTVDAVVVLRDHKKSPPHLSSASTRPQKPDTIASSPPISLAQQLGLGVRTIVIDPGHGGKDPGAIAFGMKEKDIVLKVAKSLGTQLVQKYNAKVILTREDDRFLPLEERTAIANTNDADLFISLHVNAHPSPKVSGFETYFLNLSTSEEAMRVAARENATSTHQMSDLQDILSEIMQNSKINESARLAQQVHSSIESGMNSKPYVLKDMGVKQAPFYVLIGAEMPAILIELAFISNPRDAQLLANNQFIEILTQQISDGVLEYINANTAQL